VSSPLPLHLRCSIIKIYWSNELELVLLTFGYFNFSLRADSSAGNIDFNRLLCVPLEAYLGFLVGHFNHRTLVRAREKMIERLFHVVPSALRPAIFNYGCWNRFFGPFFGEVKRNNAHTYPHTRKMSMMADVYHLSMSENGQKTPSRWRGREKEESWQEIDNESHHLAVKVKTKRKKRKVSSAHTTEGGRGGRGGRILLPHFGFRFLTQITHFIR
jgi:hypothetical protein